MAISENKYIAGHSGHCTAIFKRPILEGSYFLELTIKNDIPHDKKVEYPSAVRLGICPHNYSCFLPLGRNDSLAYKSVDGSLITKGNKV
jgi:hypothetical protein